MPVRACRDSCRRAMTLIELLVVIGVLTLLAAIILPAVQFARQSARRVQCLNNLRQIGLAIQSYHEAVGSLPPGRFLLYDPRFAGANPPCSSTSVDKSFLVEILPFIDNSPLYNTINQSLAIVGPENTTVWSVPVSAYACPCDVAAGRPHLLDPAQLPSYGIPALTDDAYFMVFASYAGCFGSLNTSALPTESRHCFVAPQNIAQNNGCFNDRSPIRFASVTDGMSHTLLCAERTNFIDRYDRNGWYVTGNLGDTLFTALRPPNPRDAGGSLLVVPSAASSLHPGGVATLMADGSARFIKESIQSWPFDSLTRGPSGAVINPKTSVIYGRPGSAARKKLENPRESWKNTGWVRSAYSHH
ncbi:MAG: DUF1559 family PulG-like putative transporter, partial [Isosphaeraceae bacterium]